MAASLATQEESPMTLELAHVLGSEAIETATSVPITYARLAGLPVEIESCEFTPIVRDTSSGFTKITTVVRLRGRGEEGLGEDVTWDQIDHIEFLRHPMPHQLEGAWELDELSGALGEMDLFPVAPCRPASRRYRRWAFESAALDLGLRQAGLSLADALGRTPQPVRFVSSGSRPRWSRSVPVSRATRRSSSSSTRHCPGLPRRSATSPRPAA
jgi:hypothetical protein